MSYILDALTKSELERQRGAVPDLSTFHEATEPVRRPTRILAVLVTVVVAGAAILVARPLGDARPPAHGHERAQPQGAVDAEAERRRTQSGGMQSTRHHAAEHRSSSAPGGGGAGTEVGHGVAPPLKTARVIDAAPDRVLRDEHAASPPASARSTRPSSPAASRRAAELPPDIAVQVPEISVTGYLVVPGTNERMIVVNDRVVAMGEEIAAGLRVEDIDPGGVTLSYRGHRFRKAY